MGKSNVYLKWLLAFTEIQEIVERINLVHWIGRVNLTCLLNKLMARGCRIFEICQGIRKKEKFIFSASLIKDKYKLWDILKIHERKMSWLRLQLVPVLYSNYIMFPDFLWKTPGFVFIDININSAITVYNIVAVQSVNKWWMGS